MSTNYELAISMGAPARFLVVGASDIHEAVEAVEAVSGGARVHWGLGTARSEPRPGERLIDARAAAS